MLPHVTPAGFILTGFVLGCLLLCVLAEFWPRPGRRDEDEPPETGDGEDEQPLPLAA